MEQQNQSDLFTELSFDHTARQHLRSLASWAMVLVVLAVIGYLISLVGIFNPPKQIDPTFEGFDTGYFNRKNGKFWTILGIAVGLLINFFLFRFATMAKAGVDGYDQVKMSGSFNNLKAFFMAMAIVLIVIFVIFLLAITFILIAGPAAI